jgi:uncharacterized membrane protein YjgN (DUF898 family)
MNDMRPPRGASVLPTVPAAESPATHQVVYDGRVGDLARIAVSNALLGLLSLGIYRFWGKTRLRQYLWGRVAFLGDRMEYSGTAKELLIGFLVALIILAPLIGGFMVVELAFEGDLKVIAAKELVQLLVILFVIQLAIYRARRYRLTRTQWRGIRAGQTGSAFKYGFLAFGWMIVAMLTLGLAYPVYRTRLQRYRTENTWFGDRRLEFRGEAAQLFGSWVLTWLLLLPTFGLIYAWYRAKEFRYFVSKTEYGALRFGSELSAVSVFLIYLAYYIAVSAVIGTVSGLALGVMPVLSLAYMDLTTGNTEAMLANDLTVNLTLIAFIALVVVLFGVIRILFYVHPFFRVVCRSLRVIGEEDYTAIAQNQHAMPGRGEGFADTLDVGAF